MQQRLLGKSEGGIRGIPIYGLRQKRKYSYAKMEFEQKFINYFWGQWGCGSVGLCARAVKISPAQLLFFGLDTLNSQCILNLLHRLIPKN